MPLAPIMRLDLALQQQIRVKMYLLSVAQQEAAGDMVMRIHQLYLDNDQKLGEFVAPDDWFLELPKAAQQQVIDFYATLTIGLSTKQAILTWYDQRQEFRFERSIHPAP